MADTPNGNNSGRENTTADRSPTSEERLAAKLPPQETNQPDPILQLSVGHLGAGSMTLVAIAAAIILGVVLYGLNGPAPNTASPAVATSAAPQAGGKAGPAAPSGQHTGNTGHS